MLVCGAPQSVSCHQSLGLAQGVRVALQDRGHPLPLLLSLQCHSLCCCLPLPSSPSTSSCTAAFWTRSWRNLSWIYQGQRGKALLCFCHSVHPDPQPLTARLGSGQEEREAQPGIPAGSVTGLFLQHREPSTGQSAVCQCQRSVLGKAFPSFSGFPAHRYALEIFTNWRGLWQLGHLGMSLLMEAKRMEQGPAGHGFAHPSRCLGATSGGHALVFVVRLSPP